MAIKRPLPRTEPDAKKYQDTIAYNYATKACFYVR
jgi:hypothetical protein